MIYVQRESADVWRKNILTNLESEDWEFPLVGDLLVELKREFEKGGNELIEVAELKQVE